MVSPRSTLRRVYATPRGSHPCNVFVLLIDCGSSIVQKQSVSNAFQYVVLRPPAPSSSDDIPAARGKCRCKITHFILNLTPEKEKSSKKFGISEKIAYLCSVRNDYPGKFPERASRIRHYPFLKQAASFGVRFCF